MLEKKVSDLVDFGKIEVQLDGVNEQRNHSTFGGLAKRHYYYEENSKLGSTVITSRDSVFFIGANSYFNGGGYSRENVIIGRYCSIGRRVTLAAGAHAMGGLSTSPIVSGQRSQAQLSSKYANRTTIICSDVWIGDGAVIMPGRTVGVGAVIAANAVVTKDVDSHTVVGGVPATVIGRRFSEDISRKIVESRWWDIEKKYLDQLNTRDIKDFLSNVPTNNDFVYPTYLYDDLD